MRGKTLAVTAAVAFLAAGCGHHGTTTGAPSAEPTTPAYCVEGGPVGQILPPDLSVQPYAEGGIPACAANRGKVLTYDCVPQAGAPAQGSVFVFEPYQGQVSLGYLLYGRTGGTWLEATNVPNPYALGPEVGC